MSQGRDNKPYWYPGKHVIGTPDEAKKAYDTFQSSSWHLIRTARKTEEIVDRHPGVVDNSESSRL